MIKYFMIDEKLKNCSIIIFSSFSFALQGPSATPYPQAAAPMAAGQFDAGARFTPYAPPSVPPPPPGCTPNAAQMAAAQGQNVNMSQKSGGFFKGSGSGGYTFW